MPTLLQVIVGAVTALSVGFLGAKWLNKWSQGEQLKWLGAKAAHGSENPELGIALAQGDTGAAKDPFDTRTTTDQPGTDSLRPK